MPLLRDITQRGLSRGTASVARQEVLTVALLAALSGHGRATLHEMEEPLAELTRT
jgi:hypothetical protein